MQIISLAGVPVGVVGEYGRNEVRWYNPDLHAGLYVYRMDVKLEDGQERVFYGMLEVYKK